MFERPTLSVIIGFHNNTEYLFKTLNALVTNTKNIDKEIIVIDDASQQTVTKHKLESIAQQPVILLRNKTNLGYSKSYNKGTRKANGRYILHLNSDIRIVTSKMKSLIDYLDNHPEIGIAGGRILKLDGTLDLPCRRSFPTIGNIVLQSLGLYKLFPNNRHFSNYYLTYTDEQKPRSIDCIMGAFMIIRKDVVKNIGLLDETFFIYGEDIDYCYRAKKGGWHVYYYPPLVLEHYHGKTTSNTKNIHIWRFHKAMMQYYEKHFAHHSVLSRLVVHGGILTRYAIVTVLELVK